MAADDATRWDARYAHAAVAVPTPPDALIEADLGERFPTEGRALDVACGAGAQAVWLASRGLTVTAIDASPVAVDLTRRAADAAGVGDCVDARCLDLDHGISDDLGSFDAIVCQRFRSPDLYPSFVERLRPGGIAVVTVLSRTGADGPGRFHAPSSELRDAFTRADSALLFHRESDGQESVVVQRHPT